MSRRPRLTYANVAATLALVIAVGGGTVFAAVQLSKNNVRSRHIAPKAVKKSDIAPNAVTGRKIKNRSVFPGDLAVGLLNKVVDVRGSARGGPQGDLGVVGPVPAPLTGVTRFTSAPGEVVALAGEARFILASTTAGQNCDAVVRLFVDGQPTRVFISPEGNDTVTPVTRLARDADGPYGLLDPGTTHQISAELSGDVHCTPASTVDRLEVRIVQIG